jgi:hypothetical protein
MGGEVGVLPGAAPRFVVLAAKDPGTADVPGNDLERVQIVKGWVDASGATHERVYDVAGAAGPGVEPATCAPTGRGATELCADWQDPEFDPRERAFYYARVLEAPSCRWSTLVCKEAGVDPFAADCAAQAARAGEPFADCCLTQEEDAFLEPVVRERAWTSPVWYRPDAIARLAGGIAFGAGEGRDAIDLTIELGALPAAAAAAGTVDLTLSDRDAFYRATIVLGDHRAGEPATLAVRASDVDLRHVDRRSRFVTATLEAGPYRAVHTRLWEGAGDRLSPASGG